ncbi:MAG: serine/threonine protein kinase [Acaryochloridaceae cyanobacterium CSU_3_4]|nr:serine/threonine protein kinase [Acaryochloridaceae cyanobacterium CSU_3_4]
MHNLINQIHCELLPQIQLESLEPHNPIVVHYLPQPWQLLGIGNYAAVVSHPDYGNLVVKIYAPGRPGFEEEVEVYRRLGQHPAFSECFYAGQGFLILKRLQGVTLYDCMHRGIKILPSVIRDIDQALHYARSVGLNPHDVHGKNLMIAQEKGLVVDVSDFLKLEACSAWEDLKRAYYCFYLPVLSRLPMRFPYRLLDLIRAFYRFYRRAWQRDLD